MGIFMKINSQEGGKKRKKLFGKKLLESMTIV